MSMDSPIRIYVAGALLAVALYAGGMTVLFGDEVEQLPIRTKTPPPPPEETVIRELRYGTEYYRSLLVEDAKRYGVFTPDFSEFIKPFPRFVEFSGRQQIFPKKEGSLETEHLKISVEVRKEWAQALGGGITADHVILKIANKTNRHLAYRVVTDPLDARRCRSKAELPHNAIALMPEEEVARTECIVDSTTAIYITRVEVIEIPPLSYHYLCRLRPIVLLLDERTSAGHQVGRQRPCDPIAWPEIKAGAEAKEVEWADVVDFYARHPCDEYTFFRGYKYATQPLERLPALPPGKR